MNNPAVSKRNNALLIVRFNVPDFLVLYFNLPEHFSHNTILDASYLSLFLHNPLYSPDFNFEIAIFTCNGLDGP